MREASAAFKAAQQSKLLVPARIASCSVAGMKSRIDTWSVSFESTVRDTLDPYCWKPAATVGGCETQNECGCMSPEITVAMLARNRSGRQSGFDVIIAQEGLVVQ